MGGQVCRILKIQGREREGCSLHVLCERSSGEFEKEWEVAREHLLDDVKEGRLSL